MAAIPSVKPAWRVKGYVGAIPSTLPSQLAASSGLRLLVSMGTGWGAVHGPL